MTSSLVGSEMCIRDRHIFLWAGICTAVRLEVKNKHAAVAVVSSVPALLRFGSVGRARRHGIGTVNGAK
eukprot:11966321-Prorocentrum_lima.AAC.1